MIYFNSAQTTPSQELAVRIQFVGLMAFCLSTGCFACAGAGAQKSAELSSGREVAAANAPLAPTIPGKVDPEPTLALESSDNAAKLESLWNQRMSEGAGSLDNFTLGPGDLLRISVPPIDQLKDETLRVSEEGTIALPLIGVVNVEGMSEEDLRAELTHRLAKYMYHPQVEVFLKHTEHREVAVLGDIKRPGRYMLSSQSDSLRTMISRAGGLNAGAASRIILIPSPPRFVKAMPVAGQPREMLFDSSLKHQWTMSSVSVGSAPEVDGNALGARKEFGQDEVVIDTSKSEGEHYLEMFARAGDVIVAPAAGQVTVEGWVDKPGAYNVTPGLTVLGVIAAAGGANFTSSAMLLRETDSGKLQIPLDLSKIKHGEVADVNVQSGDVVIVEKSVIGAVPYSVYFLLNKLTIFPAIPL